MTNYTGQRNCKYNRFYLNVVFEKAPARKKVTAAKTAKDKTAGKLVRTVKAKTPAKKSVKEEKAAKAEEAVKAEKKAETVKKRATVKNDNNKADRNSK